MFAIKTSCVKQTLIYIYVKVSAIKGELSKNSQTEYTVL